MVASYGLMRRVASLPIWLVSGAFGLVSSATVCHADAGFADGQPWGLEVGFGWGRTPSSGYTETLEEFGFEKNLAVVRPGFRVSLAVERRIVRHFSLLLQANSLDRQEYEIPGPDPDETFRWTTWALGIHGRASLGSRNGKVRGYAQFGVGPTVSVTRFRTRLDPVDPEQAEFDDAQWYYHLTGLLGFEGMLAKHFGMFVNGGYVYARTPVNELDQRNRGGGGLVLAGLSGRFGRK
jgi:hypothetical protein